MVRFSASILSVRTATLIGSVLLMGATPATQEPRVSSNLAINQMEDGIFPLQNGIFPLLENGAQKPAELNDKNTETDTAAAQRKQFLLIQGAFAAAVGISALALAYGVRSYTKYHQLQRIDFLRRATREFENDPGIAYALSILDFEKYRDYPLNMPESTKSRNTTFKVTNTLLSNALSHSIQRKEPTAHSSKANPDPNHLLSDEEKYYATTSIRDWFNQMLNGLEHFGYMVNSQVFKVEEIKPWLNYWVRLIADENHRRNVDSRVYEKLYNYIYDHGFHGVRQLFEKLGYRILPSPYKDDDFKGLFKKKQDFNQYNPKLALSLAKASRLVYEDVPYMARIIQQWGVDMGENFRFFNSHNRDTQAFMFRTNECMVLIFRGTQEVRDWSTNLDTKLRDFKIRQSGITVMSSYRGKVHTGFFLGWAEIERAVLKQFESWRKASPNGTLPPLFIAGHSLGGALATMAAASLKDNNYNVSGLYTFGQPRVGDLAFTRKVYKDLSGQVYRFVNNNDVVPHVPPPFSVQNPRRLYGHVGTAKYFNSKGLLAQNNRTLYRALDGLIGLIKSISESGLDLITDHSMAYYISNLEKAMQAEKLRQTGGGIK